MEPAYLRLFVFPFTHHRLLVFLLLAITHFGTLDLLHLLLTSNYLYYPLHYLFHHTKLTSLSCRSKSLSSSGSSSSVGFNSRKFRATRLPCFTLSLQPPQRQVAFGGSGRRSLPHWHFDILPSAHALATECVSAAKNVYNTIKCNCFPSVGIAAATSFSLQCSRCYGHKSARQI